MQDGQIDVIDFLEALEVENVSIQGNTAVFSCPFEGHAHGDSNPSSVMNLETTSGQCYGCHLKFNAITFLAKHQQISNYQAFKFINDMYVPDFVEPRTTLLDEIDEILSEAEYEEQQYISLEQYESTYGALELNQEAYDYMTKERKFDRSVLAAFGVRASKQWVTIPIYNRHGLVGVKGRAVDKDHNPRYLTLGKKGGHQRYNTNDFLYNVQYVEFGSELIVVEGELNVLALAQMGYDNVVAFGGSALGPKQIEQLLEVAGSVVLFFDDDKPGKKAQDYLATIVEREIPTYEMAPSPDAADILKNSRNIKEAESAMQELLLSKKNTIERLF